MKYPLKPRPIYGGDLSEYDFCMTQSFYQRTTLQQRHEIERLGAGQLREYQLDRLNQLLDQVLPTNKFYQQKFGKNQSALKSLDELDQLPLTTKDDLLASNSPEGFAANLTHPVEHYSRFHRTSGTKGRPMIVLDTNEDWSWWMEAWQCVLDSAQMSSSDRVVMAFSFGPFIGFWSAFDAAVERGAMVVPTGAMSSIARLELIDSIKATIIFCTPSYALHLVQVAKENSIDLGSLAVEKIIVAGEPGGSIPSIKDRIEEHWKAKVVDHCGASEVGPWGYAAPDASGIYINEAQFYPEFVSIETGEPASEGELSELILTTLGRVGSPVIRYQTGDLVTPIWQTDCENNFVLLKGGVLGRTDDMMIIRGVNVFPTSIEQILRGFPEISEYRMTAYKQAEMDQLKIEIEDSLNAPDRIRQELEVRLGFRVDVEVVQANTLPRFEAKGKRFVDQR